MPDNNHNESQQIDQLLTNWTAKNHAKASQLVDKADKESIYGKTRDMLSQITIHKPMKQNAQSTPFRQWMTYASHGSQSDDGLFLLAAAQDDDPGYTAKTYGVAVDIMNGHGALLKVNAWVSSSQQSQGELKITGQDIQGRKENGRDVTIKPPLKILEDLLNTQFKTNPWLKPLNLPKRNIFIDIDSPAALEDAKSLMLATLMAIIKAATGYTEDDHVVYSASVEMDGALSSVGFIPEKAAFMINQTAYTFLIALANATDFSETLVDQFDDRLVVCRSIHDVMQFHGIKIPVNKRRPISETNLNDMIDHNYDQTISPSPPCISFLKRLATGEKNLPDIVRGDGTETYHITHLISPQPHEIKERNSAICQATCQKRGTGQNMLHHVMIKIVQCATSYEHDTILQDANMHMKGLHPNILELTSDPFMIDKELIIPMEKGEGTLDDIKNTVDVNTKVQWTSQLISALHAIHQKNRAHGDIKLKNVFMVNGIPKIADFGLSTFGTPGYRHPELIDACNENTLIENMTINDRIKWDGYAMGMLIYRFFCGKPEGVSSKLAQASPERIGLSEDDIQQFNQVLNDHPSRKSMIEWVHNAVNDGFINGNIILPQSSSSQPIEDSLKDSIPFSEQIKVIYYDSIKKMIQTHPIWTGLIAVLCFIWGSFACSMMSQALYDKLFVEFHYLYFGSLIMGIMPILLKNMFKETIANRIHPILLIIFVGFFLGAYVTPLLYTEPINSSCSSDRVFRQPISKECCENLVQQCEALKAENKWQEIIQIIQGQDLIRAGIQPTDPCYINVFKLIMYAKFELANTSQSKEECQKYVASIQKDYLNLLTCQQVLLNHLSQTPKDQVLNSQDFYPKKLLREIKQWTLFINNKKYELLTPELTNKIEQAIENWTILEKRRENQWKTNK